MRSLKRLSLCLDLNLNLDSKLMYLKWYDFKFIKFWYYFKSKDFNDQFVKFKLLAYFKVSKCISPNINLYPQILPYNRIIKNYRTVLDYTCEKWDSSLTSYGFRTQNTPTQLIFGFLPIFLAKSEFNYTYSLKSEEKEKRF